MGQHLDAHGGRLAAGEVFKPAVEDWRQLDDMRVPDYTHPDCAARMAETFCQPTDKFKLAFIGGWVFNDTRYLRKMEVYFADLALYPDELRRLHEIVAGVYERKIRLAAAAGAEGIFFCEDMGTQTGLLFSPRMFRHYFKELYARLWGIAHELGMKVFEHSCGQNWAILPDLLDAGVDVFQLDQPTLYDMPALAESAADARGRAVEPGRHPEDHAHRRPGADRGVCPADDGSLRGRPDLQELWRSAWHRCD